MGLYQLYLPTDIFRRLMGYYKQSEPVYVYDFAIKIGSTFRMAVSNIGEAPAKTFAE